MTSSFPSPKEWGRKRKLQNFGLKFRGSLGPEPRNFSSKSCNFLLRTRSFGVWKLEFICLFENHFILKFLFLVVFKHCSFCRGRVLHEIVVFTTILGTQFWNSPCTQKLSPRFFQNLMSSLGVGVMNFENTASRWLFRFLVPNLSLAAWKRRSRLPIADSLCALAACLLRFRRDADNRWVIP